MAIYQISDDYGTTTNVAVGLKWLTHSGDRRKSLTMARKSARQERIRHPGVCVGERYCGVLSLQGHKGDCYAVAALFAEWQVRMTVDADEGSHATWIAIEQFSDGFWTALIVDGEIALESEELLSEEDAIANTKRYTELTKTRANRYEYVGGGRQALLGLEDSDITLRELLTALDKSERAHALLTRDRAGQWLKIGVLVVGCGVLVYRLGVLDTFLGADTEQEIQRQRIAAAITAANQHYGQLLGAPSLGSAVSEFAQQWSAWGWEDAPWPLTGVQCDTTSGLCTASFANLHKLSIASIKGFLANRCDSVTLTTQGSAAMCDATLSLTAPQELAQPGETAEHLTEQLLTLVPYTTTIDISDPEPSIIPGAELAPAHMIHKQGAVTITGPYNELREVVPAAMQSLSWATISSIKIETQPNNPMTEPTLTLEANYVITQ